MVLPAGALIDAKYRVVRLLGQGGMGAVYEVENVLVRRSAALKLLPLGSSPELVARFEAEAQAAGRAGSKRIVDVLDLGRTPDGQAYLVMELLEGETLRDELRRARRLGARRAAALVADVLHGLEAAHAAGIVHRDLKPENIWVLAPSGASGADAPLVKILDFGVSKFTSVEDGRPKTAEGVMIGTCWYMSPEQIRDARRSDARSDVYALGVILYELLSGNVPFPGTTLPEMLYRVLDEEPPPLALLAPQAPETLVRITMRALAKKPDDRFPCAASMREHLVAFLEQRPLREGPELELPPPDRAPRHRADLPTQDAPSPIASPAAAAPAGVIPTPTPMAAAPAVPPQAPPAPAPLSLAEPLPTRHVGGDDGVWPRAPLAVGALALLVIVASLTVGALFRTGVLGG